MAITDNARVERTYDRWSHVYDLAFGKVLQSGRNRAVSGMRLRAGQRVLEVGVGTGLTLPLYPTDWQVVGLDFSTPMLNRARARVARMIHADHIRLLQADAARLPFDDEVFDVVYAPYVIAVVPEPVQVARELRRVCRPGGRVVLLNHFQSEQKAAAWLERAVSPFTTHLGFRTDLALRPLLASSGLRPLSIHAVNVPPIWKLVVCARK